MLFCLLVVFLPLDIFGAGPAFGMANTISSGGGINPGFLDAQLGDMIRPTCSFTSSFRVNLSLTFPKIFTYQLDNVSIATPAVPSGQDFAALYVAPNANKTVNQMWSNNYYAVFMPIDFAIPGCTDSLGNFSVPLGEYSVSLSFSGLYAGPLTPFGGSPVPYVPYTQTIEFTFHVTTGSQSGYLINQVSNQATSSRNFGDFTYQSPVLFRKASPSQFNWNITSSGDYALLKIKQQDPSIGSLRIYDLQGRLVLFPFKEQFWAAGEHMQKVSLEGLNKGLYIFQYVHNGQVYSQSYLKN